VPQVQALVLPVQPQALQPQALVAVRVLLVQV
jgi:hypothetical protein